jgi:hypothetical protein
MPNTQLRSITQPSCFRTGKNLGVSDIPAKRIVKAGATVDELALATAATDVFEGVTTEIIYAGKSQSVQCDGRAVLTAGAAVAIGDEITSDANGKGVTAVQSVGSTQRVIGTAKTATTGADEDFEIELRQSGRLHTAVLAVTDRAAMKAIAATARFDGMQVLVKTDRSLWVFVAAATQATDGVAGSEHLVAVPGAGTGRWLRLDKSFVASFPFDFNTLDAAALITIPEGFTARLPAFPHWEIAVAMTGGASSAIGVSSSKTGYTTKGDILGGAAGDVAAGLTAGIKLGTIGPKLDTLAEWQALLLVEGDTLRFDRITSQFAAGNGFVRVPLLVTCGDSPVTP